MREEGGLEGDWERLDPRETLTESDLHGGRDPPESRTSASGNPGETL